MGAKEEGLDQHISLYAKTNGRAGQENKYDFPPPVDERLFFGTCALVGKSVNGLAVDLCEDDWEEIYEFLFGGFEDIGSEDSEDMDTEDELEAISKAQGVVVKQTKQGYAKDGFIVDDDEEDEDFEESDDESSESDDTPPPRKGRKPATTAVKKATTPIAKKTTTPAKKVTTTTSSSQIEPPPATAQRDLSIDDCESELSEESYN